MNDTTAYSTPPSRSHDHAQSYRPDSNAHQSQAPAPTQAYYGSYNSDGTFSNAVHTEYSRYGSDGREETSHSYEVTANSANSQPSLATATSSSYLTPQQRPAIGISHASSRRSSNASLPTPISTAPISSMTMGFLQNSSYMAPTSPVSGSGSVRGTLYHTPTQSQPRSQYQVSVIPPPSPSNEYSQYNSKAPETANSGYQYDPMHSYRPLLPPVSTGGASSGSANTPSPVMTSRARPGVTTNLYSSSSGVLLTPPLGSRSQRHHHDRSFDIGSHGHGVSFESLRAGNSKAQMRSYGLIPGNAFGSSETVTSPPTSRGRVSPQRTIHSRKPSDSLDFATSPSSEVRVKQEPKEPEPEDGDFESRPFGSTFIMERPGDMYVVTNSRSRADSTPSRRRRNSTAVSKRTSNSKRRRRSSPDRESSSLSPLPSLYDIDEEFSDSGRFSVQKPPEVVHSLTAPLRASHATPAMKALMGVFRLDPFASLNGVALGTHASSSAVQFDEDAENPGGKTWEGLDPGPLRERPIFLEFQLHIPGIEEEETGESYGGDSNSSAINYVGTAGDEFGARVKAEMYRFEGQDDSATVSPTRGNANPFLSSESVPYGGMQGRRSPTPPTLYEFSGGLHRYNSTGGVGLGIAVRNPQSSLSSIPQIQPSSSTDSTFYHAPSALTAHDGFSTFYQRAQERMRERATQAQASSNNFSIPDDSLPSSTTPTSSSKSIPATTQASITSNGTTVASTTTASLLQHLRTQAALRASTASSMPPVNGSVSGNSSGLPFPAVSGVGSNLNVASGGFRFGHIPTPASLLAGIHAHSQPQHPPHPHDGNPMLSSTAEGPDDYDDFEFKHKQAQPISTSNSQRGMNGATTKAEAAHFSHTPQSDSSFDQDAGCSQAYAQPSASDAPPSATICYSQLVKNTGAGTDHTLTPSPISDPGIAHPNTSSRHGSVPGHNHSSYDCDYENTSGNGYHYEYENDERHAFEKTRWGGAIRTYV